MAAKVVISADDAKILTVFLREKARDSYIYIYVRARRAHGAHGGRALSPEHRGTGGATGTAGRTARTRAGLAYFRFFIELGALTQGG